MSASAMNTVINNNRKLLTKRDRLKNTLSGYKRPLKVEYTWPKTSTKQLHSIRRRLKEERQIRMLKVVTLTLLLCVLMLVGLLYMYAQL